jgi:FtsP/CotA-like multicopper oxidase with cupredoxin domain
MRIQPFKLNALALPLVALFLPAGQALAAEVYLQAAATSVSMPNPDGSANAVVVPMWGYQSCTGFSSADTCSPVSVPGPALTVPASDRTLTVHLRNQLPVPTSLVVNGLHKQMVPVRWEASSKYPNRVRSFDLEASANGGQNTYTWDNIKPGTYLYQSGTQPQVQVQMGLYGALSRNQFDAAGTTRAQAYPSATSTYDNHATLLYSEIDPALHDAVATGNYDSSTPGSTGPTSTFNYVPKYFLVNGQPFPGNAVITTVGAPGTTLLRLLNAGLTTHVPMIQGLHWDVVAEDGKPYPYAARQYTALLPAAKTADVLISLPVDIGGSASYAVMDRRLSLSNNGLSQGGMMTFVRYGAQGVAGAADLLDGNHPPLAKADAYASVVGVTMNVAADASVLLNDTDVDTPPPLPLRAVAASGSTSQGGSYQLSSNGTFSYTPPAGYEGADTFTYQVTDGKALSNAAVVTITLSKPTAPDLALLDDFNRADAARLGTTTPAATPLPLSWSQQVSTAGSSAPDIGITGNTATSNTVALGGLALLNQTFGSTQGASFTAQSLSDSALVLKASGGTDATPVNFVRVRCEAIPGGTDALVIATMMGGSNVSVYAKQASVVTNLCSGGGTLSAVVNAKGLVTAFINGIYIGGVQLPSLGVWTGSGKIGIQLQSTTSSVDDFSGSSL